MTSEKTPPLTSEKDNFESLEDIQDKLAVSLEYEGEGAPKVTAKGRGYVAKEILEKAEQYDIPIQKDGDLVNLLSEVELNNEIPEKLYEAVAQVLVFAYEVSGKKPPVKNKNSDQ